MPTGNAFLDSIAPSIGGHIGLLSEANMRNFLLHAVMQDVGIVIVEPSVIVENNVVRYVNQTLLTLLGYADQAAFQSAIQAAEFVHPDDASVRFDHVVHMSTALYIIRLLRGDNGNYRRCRLQQGIFHYGGSDDQLLRMSIISAATG